MNVSLLIQRDNSEWMKALTIMQCALAEASNQIGLRKAEHAEVLSRAASALLNNDCRILRRARQGQTTGLIHSVTLSRARNLVRSRRRRENNEVSVPHETLEALGVATQR